MIDTPYRPVEMSPAERHKFCRKARADRMAYEAASQLDLRQLDTAARLARDAVALVGPDRLAFWLRHYATMQFNVAVGVVDAFLRRVLPAFAAASY